MDSLIKQMRGRYAGAGQGSRGEPRITSERRVPIQKTQSFKGEMKGAQSWFRRQLSGQQSKNYDSNNEIGHVAAVAAAACAITSAEESSIPHKNKTSDGPEPFWTKLKSKKEDAKASIAGESSMKNMERPDRKLPIAAPIPSTKKTTTFSDKEPNNTSGVTPETTAAKTYQPRTEHKSTASKPELPTIKPGNAAPKFDRLPPTAPAFPPTETKGQTSTRPGIGETKADAWEREELLKIKERHEKVNSTILTWENKKKTKARRRLDKTESELERKRAKAMQKFRSDMEYIDQIAGGARAKAEERRRNEELKAKDKANTIRTTGKVPGICPCC